MSFFSEPLQRYILYSVASTDFIFTQSHVLYWHDEHIISLIIFWPISFWSAFHNATANNEQNDTNPAVIISDWQQKPTEARRLRTFPSHLTVRWQIYHTAAGGSEYTACHSHVLNPIRIASMDCGPRHQKIMNVHRHSPLLNVQPRKRNFLWMPNTLAPALTETPLIINTPGQGRLRGTQQSESKLRVAFDVFILTRPYHGFSVPVYGPTNVTLSLELVKYRYYSLFAPQVHQPCR